MLSLLILAAGFFATSVSGHAFLAEDSFPSFGRLSGKYAGEPVNFAGVPQEFCKGWQKGADKSKAKATKTGPNKITFGTPMAAHGGGSMQVSLSFDEGKTFKVIKSFLGNFPKTANGESNEPTKKEYDFNIPPDTKAGYAILSWSWNNFNGNPEWYQDCAPIMIEGSGANTLDDRPDIFVSNVPAMTSCKTGGKISVLYPGWEKFPKGEVVDERDGRPSEVPKGDCGKVTGSGGGGGGGGGSGEGAPPPPPPGKTGTTYTVKSGDDCNKIGATTGLSFADLRAKNPAINEGCTNLVPEQVLNLRKRSRIMFFN